MNNYKKVLGLVIIFLIINFIFNKSDKQQSLYQLKTIPVLHEGRIKPLDSYARILLKSIANKEAINNQDASTWLIKLLLNPKEDYKTSLFYIHNPELQDILDLKHKPKPYYSFKEILPGIKENINLISNLEQAKHDKQPLQPAQQQLLELYHNSLLYFDVSRSLSALLPELDLDQVQNVLNINSDKITEHKKLSYNNKISYYQLLPYKDILVQKVDKAINNNQFNQDTLSIANKFKDIANDRINTSLKLIPHNTSQTTNQNWLSLWEANTSKLNIQLHADYLNLWQALVYSYYHNNENELNSISYSIHSLAINNNQITTKNKLLVESIFNKYKFFDKSVILYFITLLLALTSLLQFNQKNKSLLLSSSKIAFMVAVACHLIGLVARVYILGRPPVSNLYESILFVGLIISMISLAIDFARKDNIGVLLGSIICTALQFIAGSYAQTGDTMGVLIAVLDNNFWLGTHVIAITSGYGCCLILSGLSHYYLFKLAIYKNQDGLLSLQKYILVMSLLALFLTLLGTILGGIWADQSWGRFWGWDPKENGAMLICLWLICLLHGRISGHLNYLKFITGCALTSITVALAWFGVNLLNTGLHSYGFTENIAMNLVLFIFFELTFIIGLSFFCIRIDKININNRVTYEN